ncbi:MAG TPA: hypothetical protein EYP85_11445 [Armatimonadetes bacterium]|nr:hypothetical protein [Armatimonadota bacterium]
MSPAKWRKLLARWEHSLSPEGRQERLAALKGEAAGNSDARREALAEERLALGEAEGADYLALARWKMELAAGRQDPRWQEAVDCLDEARWHLPEEEHGAVWTWERRLAEAQLDLTGQSLTQQLEAVRRPFPLPWHDELAVRLQVGYYLYEALSDREQAVLLPHLYERLRAVEPRLRLKARWLLWSGVLARCGDVEEQAALRERLRAVLQAHRPLPEGELSAPVRAGLRRYHETACASLRTELLEPLARHLRRAWQGSGYPLVCLQARLGEALRSEELVQRAVYESRRLEDPTDLSRALALCALTLARFKPAEARSLWEEAWSNVTGLRFHADPLDELRREEALLAVLTVGAELATRQWAGEWFDRLLRECLARPLRYATVRAWEACCELVEAWPAEEAIQHLERMAVLEWDLPDYRGAMEAACAVSWVRLGVRFQRAGWWEEGIQQAQRIAHPYHRTRALSRSARVLAATDWPRASRVLAQARQAAEEVETEALRSPAWRAVWEQWALCGRARRQLAIVQEALNEALNAWQQDPYDPEISAAVRTALVALVELAAGEGNETLIAEAYRQGAQLKTPWDRCRVQCTCGEAWRGRDPPRGLRALERALGEIEAQAPSDPKWDETLPEVVALLARLDTEAAISLFPPLLVRLMRWRPPPSLADSASVAPVLHSHSWLWPLEALLTRLERRVNEALQARCQREWEDVAARL